MSDCHRLTDHPAFTRSIALEVLKNGTITAIEGWWEKLVELFKLHHVWEELMVFIEFTNSMNFTNSTDSTGHGEAGSVQAVIHWVEGNLPQFYKFLSELASPA